MKTKILVFFLMLASICHAQQQKNFTLTYDSVKIFLRDTTVTPIYAISYFRCGLNVQLLGNNVYLYTNESNQPLNVWKKNENLVFLTPTNNPIVGDSILNSIVYGGCADGPENFINWTDTTNTIATHYYVQTLIHDSLSHAKVNVINGLQMIGDSVALGGALTLPFTLIQQYPWQSTFFIADSNTQRGLGVGNVFNDGFDRFYYVGAYSYTAYDSSIITMAQGQNIQLRQFNFISSGSSSNNSVLQSDSSSESYIIDRIDSATGKMYSLGFIAYSNYIDSFWDINLFYSVWDSFSGDDSYAYHEKMKFDIKMPLSSLFTGKGATTSMYTQKNWGENIYTSGVNGVFAFEDSIITGYNLLNNTSNPTEIKITNNNILNNSPITIKDGSQGLSKVLTSDAVGNAIWAIPDTSHTGVIGTAIKSAALTGPTGPTGSNGTNGATGPTGATGATGSAGGNLAHTIFTPSTGNTISAINNNVNIINPSGAILALTINLPSSPANNDRVEIKFDQAVTTVTYGNGTIKGGLVSPPLGGMVGFTYDSGTTTWY